MSFLCKPIHLQIRVEETVQGVGLRPSIYWLDQRHRLASWVFNHPAGVEIEGEEEAGEIAQFLVALSFRALRSCHSEGSEESCLDCSELAPDPIRGQAPREI